MLKFSQFYSLPVSLTWVWLGR